MVTIRQYQFDMGGVIQATVNEDKRLDIYSNYAKLIDDLLVYSYGTRILILDSSDTTAIIGGHLLCGLYKWTTLIKSTQFEYNPIDNYDGVEQETITITHTGTDSNVYNDNTGSKTTTQTTAPYNTAPLPVGGVEEGAQSNDGNLTKTYDTTDTHTRNSTRHGNMGVTSTQSMIQQERQIADINIAMMIAREIANTIAYSVY